MTPIFKWEYLGATVRDSTRICSVSTRLAYVLRFPINMVWPSTKYMYAVCAVVNTKYLTAVREQGRTKRHEKDGQNEPNPQASLGFLKLYCVAPASSHSSDQHAGPAECEPDIGMSVDCRKAGIWSRYVPLQCVVTCDLEVVCVGRVRHGYWVG